MINKIGLILGFVGLILSIIWGVMYYDNKRHVKELIAKGEKELLILENAAKERQDSIILEVKKRDSAIKSLSVAQASAKDSLNSALRVGKRLSADLRKAKAQKDTVNYYAKGDSLSEQIAVLEVDNNLYQEKVELLNTNFKQQLLSKDSLLSSKDKLYGQLRESFEGSILKVNDLEEDKKKLQTSLQKSRRTSRWMAALGIIISGSIYIATR